MNKSLIKRIKAVEDNMSPKMVEWIVEIDGVVVTHDLIPWDKSMGRYNGQDQIIELG